MSINSDPDKGHLINSKRVDVKSADDYIKPQPGQPSNQQNLNRTLNMNNNFN